mmetsp:Transcript_8431/g.27619  ORF Transcript_8431/g.27619 Transcript_8431/m.27619 type:complete len:318 (+) Transcript_8431:130-1083(+)
MARALALVRWAAMAVGALVVLVGCLRCGVPFAASLRRPSSYLRGGKTSSKTAVAFGGDNPFVARLSSRLGFLHIPKTGGTAVEVWAKDKGLLWGKHDASLVGGKKETGCNAWHTPQRLFTRESFCVVRKPFDRLVSEYRHRACAKHATTVCAKENFEAWIEATLLEGPLTANDCHVLPQHEYLAYCDHVLLYEDLQREFAALLAGVLRGTDTDDSDNATALATFLNQSALLDVVPQPRVKITEDCDRGCDFHYDDLSTNAKKAFERTYSADLDVWNLLHDNRHTERNDPSLQLLLQSRRRVLAFADAGGREKKQQQH